MVSLIKKVFLVLLIISIGISSVACNQATNEKETDVVIESDITLSLWYTDDKLTTYLQQSINQYHDANRHVTIIPKLVEQDEYLENIYNGSIKQNDIADLYVLSSDNLEKAYLMGLTANNDSYKSLYTTNVYGKAGIEASTYNDKLLGYPLAFDMAFMVYNKKYASAMNTFSDLTNYSNNYQHTEENSEVEYIVKWDVSDVFLNYAFVGAYMNVGSTSSDDSSVIKLDTNGMKSSLNEYLKFKSDYGINRNTTTSSNCLDLFNKNKLLYTIVRTNDLKAINDAGVDYGISKIPDLTSTISTNIMSTTQLITVNPYSKNVKVAKSIAKNFTYDYSQDLYNLSGYVSARADLGNNPDAEFTNLYSLYSNSVVKAQFMNIGDFYIKLEIMLHQIWDGTNVDESLKTFHDYINTQLIKTVSN